MRKLLIIIFLTLFRISSVIAHPIDGLKKQVSKAEKHYNIHGGILDALITIESNYKIAVNPKNFKKNVFVTSFGLGQLTYSSALNHCSLSRKNILDPIKNIFCSAKILRYQLDRFDNSIPHAIAAYNQGTPCICDGKRYVQNLNGKIKACKNFNTKRIFTCTQDEIDRFLNQAYVDKFFKTLDKISSIPQSN